MEKNNFITIQGWMRTELDLRGNDLLVYAIIYGFSQDEENKFTGSLKYLADWCGATKQGIQKNLSNLLEKGLIKKSEEIKNGLKVCSYSCTPYNSVVHPIQLSCTNNIDNNTDSNTDILSKDNIYSTDGVCSEPKSDVSSKVYSKEDFLGSRKKVKQTRKLSLYEKCLQEIDNFTHSLIERNCLIEYLELRLAMKDKPIYGVSQWKGILNKLNELVKSGEDIQKVIKQSIEKGYASFYPVSSNKKYNKPQNKEVFSEYGEVSCERSGEEDRTDVEF